MGAKVSPLDLGVRGAGIGSGDGDGGGDGSDGDVIDDHNKIRFFCVCW